MTDSDLECLKANIDQVVEIEVQTGERLLIKVISVFDQESDPDVFFFDVTSNPFMNDSEQTEGCALQLHEILSVRKYETQGVRA
jgi:hypothetical protein